MKRLHLALMLGFLTTFTGCEGAAGRSFMSIGTGSTGGVYYPFGGALANRLSTSFPDRQFTAEVTAASVENVKRLEQRQIDIGMSIAITIDEAYHGSEDFPVPIQNLRIVAPMWPNPLNLMVPGGSDITSVADLRGKRVSVGAPGSGTEMVARAVLGAFDLTYDDIQERYLSFTESSSGIRDGSLEAAFLEVAFPASAVMEATTTGGARLIPIDGPRIEQLLRETPYFFAYEIPAGVYRGIDQPVPTIAELNWIVAMEDLDAEIVDRILDILRDEREALIQVNQAVGQIDLESLRSAPIPLHPATQRWIDENMSP